MGRGEFCQRSQFRRMEPAVGICGRHMNVAWRNDQKGELGNVRKGINLIALAEAQGAATEQKKRHVGTEARRNLEEPRGSDLLARESQVPQKRRGGIA